MSDTLILLYFTKRLGELKSFDKECRKETKKLLVREELKDPVCEKSQQDGDENQYHRRF